MGEQDAYAAFGAFMIERFAFFVAFGFHFNVAFWAEAFGIHSLSTILFGYNPY
jgi:hypothetical protein